MNPDPTHTAREALLAFADRLDTEDIPTQDGCVQFARDVADEYPGGIYGAPGRYYPDMPPMLPGETGHQYTDRITGADQTGRRPYDHHRNRQCSIGYHDQCSDPAGETCECPCHTTPPGQPRHDDPCAFLLVRDEDVTGVSGTGVVAQGVEFADGTVALRWLTDWPTSVVFHDRGIAAVEAVHGHGGKTRIVRVVR